MRERAPSSLPQVFLNPNSVALKSPGINSASAKPVAHCQGSKAWRMNKFHVNRRRHLELGWPLPWCLACSCLSACYSTCRDVVAQDFIILPRLAVCCNNQIGRSVLASLFFRPAHAADPTSTSVGVRPVSPSVGSARQPALEAQGGEGQCIDALDNCDSFTLNVTGVDADWGGGRESGGIRHYARGTVIRVTALAVLQ
jgi:hypothetical protein